MNKKNWNREIHINKKVLILVIFILFLLIGIYYVYAISEMKKIEDNVVVIKTASIDISLSIDGQKNQDIHLVKGEEKEYVISLESELTNKIAYKLYYIKVKGDSSLEITSENPEVEGVMEKKKELHIRFKNKGNVDLTIRLGVQGGLVGYPIELKTGESFLVEKHLDEEVLKAMMENSQNKK